MAPGTSLPWPLAPAGEGQSRLVRSTSFTAGSRPAPARLWALGQGGQSFPWVWTTVAQSQASRVLPVPFFWLLGHWGPAPQSRCPAVQCREPRAGAVGQGLPLLPLGLAAAPAARAAAPPALGRTARPPSPLTVQSPRRAASPVDLWPRVTACPAAPASDPAPALSLLSLRPALCCGGGGGWGQGCPHPASPQASFPSACYSPSGCGAAWGAAWGQVGLQGHPLFLVLEVRPVAEQAGQPSFAQGARAGQGQARPRPVATGNLFGGTASAPSCTQARLSRAPSPRARLHMPPRYDSQGAAAWLLI